MVLLTITPAIVEAIQHREKNVPVERPVEEGEPTLENPAVGKPITHGQIIELWKDLKEQGDEHTKYSLELLLRGSKVYLPPPPPKPEPVSLSAFSDISLLG